MEQKSDRYNFSKYREFTVDFESDHFTHNELCNLIKIDVEADFDGDIHTRIYKMIDLTTNEIRNLKDFPSDEQHKIKGLISDYATELFYT